MIFICQQCKQSFTIPSDKPLQESSLLSFNKSYALHPHLDDNKEYKALEAEAIKMLGESFVVLTDQNTPRRTPTASGAPQSSDMDRKITALTNIFEVASDKCQFDHPLCSECNQSIFKELDRRLKEAETDRDVYKAYLVKLSEPSQDMQPQWEQVDEKVEKELEQQLARVKTERLALKREIAQTKADSRTLDKLEQRFWEEYQDFQLQQDCLIKEENAVKQKIKVAEERLERIKRTNVFDDAFHISYDGHFGTINGFRLGRLPSQPVEWTETNAALGQVVLLLHTMAAKSNYTFAKYILIPCGSFSKMAKSDDPSTTHELYGSNDLSLGRLFWYRRFDTALTWLLNCIQKFSEYAASRDPRFKQPYAIKNEMIGGVSIKLQFNQDAKWTKALKYMLTNLKYLLAWCSKRAD